MKKTFIEDLEHFPRALSAREVSQLLQLNKDTVYRYAKDETIPSFTVGNVLRFDPKQLAKWIQDQHGTPYSELAHAIALWMQEQVLWRGGPCFLPRLLSKVFSLINYDWPWTADRLARDRSMDCHHGELMAEYKAAVAKLSLPEQRELLAEIRTGRYDEPIEQRRNEQSPLGFDELE